MFLEKEKTVHSKDVTFLKMFMICFLLYPEDDYKTAKYYELCN